MSEQTYKIAVSKYTVEQKIPPMSPVWPRFNAGFINKEITAEYILQSVYDGHAITTQHKNNWRVKENYICGQHFGLDFDNCDETSTLAHLSKDKFIQKYGAFLYTTISHTEEKPRARAIFLLDQPILQPDNYVLAVSALLWLFGTADRQCKDCVRFFYGSPHCQVEYLDNVLPLEKVKELIASYKETGRRELKRVRDDYHAPTSQQEVSDALKVIPPWQIDYDEWVGVLMAIHSEFGDVGYSLAESWGDGKQGEVDQKWKSFKSDGSSGSITIATLFGIAKRFGWNKALIV
jgi:hypothetical protein